jgi:hypothetical protein
VHDVDETGRELVPQLGQRGQVARLGELDDLRLDRAADPGEPRGLAVERELGDRDSRIRAAARR